MQIKKNHLFRIFVLVIIPFIIGSILVPHTQEIQGDTLIRPTQIQTTYFETQQYQFTHAIITPTPLPVNTIFPLANYLHFYPAVRYEELKLCIEDNGSTITFQNGTEEALPFGWTVHINNASSVFIPRNSVSCIPATMNSSYNFLWNAHFPITIVNKENLENITFTPKIIVYSANTMDYGVLQGLAFIPAFYILIFYPVVGIIKKIFKGLMEQ